MKIEGGSKSDEMHEEDIQESKQRPDVGEGGIAEERPSQESDGEESAGGDKDTSEESEFELVEQCINVHYVHDEGNQYVGEIRILQFFRSLYNAKI